MKNTITVLLLAFLFASCARSKTYTTEDGTQIVAEPYGWANYERLKQPGVTYEVSVGNVVLSVIFSETVIIPVWLTGWQVLEPVAYMKAKMRLR